MVDKNCFMFVEGYNSTDKGMEKGLQVVWLPYCRFGAVFGCEFTLCHKWHFFSVTLKE